MAVHIPEIDRAELDRLLEGYMLERLSDGEMLNLIDLLIRVRENAKTMKGDKMAAAIVLRVIEQEKPGVGK